MRTQDQYNVCKQTIRNQYIKIELLNFQFQTIDEISGNVISGSVNIDANADIRRTCSISLVTNDSSFDIKSGGEIWLDRYIKIWLGIDNISTQETVWFNYGIYLIDAPSWQYDATNNTLSFQGVDLMAKLTGLRNGYLPGLPVVINQGSSVRETMIATLTQFGGFNKYVIEDCKLKDGTVQSVPYDITIDQGGTIYDILSQLRDILPNYEIFFDVDGVFHYQLIPTGQNEVISADDDIMMPNLISEQINTDFASVKNVVEVYGRSKTPTYYSSSTTVSSSTYVLTISEVTSYVDNIMYGFTVPSVVTSPHIRINNLAARPLVLSDGNYAVIPEANTYYVAKYQAASNNFLFMGHQQSYAISEDANPDSPFYVNGTVGKIRTVKCGGDYDNIMSDELAKQRSDYELWLSTRMQDSINLQLVAIHFMDVNQLISHATKSSDTQIKYIIKSISVDLSYSGTQDISAITYYPTYPDI